MNQQEYRNATFNQFIKLLADCERHPGEVANMVVTKEEVEPRGLVCGLCLFGAEGAKAKELQPKSLKLMLLQIHQSCSALLANVPASAFVDHHINLIRGVAKTHFKEMEANLQPAIAVYFQRIRELLNGKYFHQFYTAMANLTQLQAHGQGQLDARELTKWNQRLLHFLFAFERLACEYDEYMEMPLQEKMMGCNLIKYIKGEVGIIYKQFRQKVQGSKKAWQEEQILELFNPYESSSKSFRFSTTMLHHDLKIEDNKKLKMSNLPDNEFTLISLIEPCIGNKKRSIRLKMDGIKGWVAAGIAYKSSVQNLGYKFEQPTHGTVQMSFDGYSWGNDATVNEVYTSWYFNEQDILTVTVNPSAGELVFTRNEEANPYTLKFKKEKKDKLYFCVSVNYSGDEVTILD